MKITVLVDNNTLIGKNLNGEPGLSFFIEDDGIQILFDTGLSELFMKNAHKLGISLDNIDYVVISHGHDDHIGGLLYLINYYKDYNIKNRPKLLIHPIALMNKISENKDIGNFLNDNIISMYFDVIKTSEPYHITDKLVYLGEINRKYEFEKFVAYNKINFNGKIIPDNLIDDTAIAYNYDKGIVVITGCSHSGICNIIEHSKDVIKKEKIYDVIGGFHLLNPTEDKLNGTLEYFRSMQANTIYPCHCTSFKYKKLIDNVSYTEEIGCGSVLEYI